MGGRPKPKPHLRKSIIKQTLENKKSRTDLESDGCLLVSFRHLDTEQGQRLHEWQELKILADAIENLRWRCADTIHNQRNTDTFTVYGDFPPKDKTDFYYPEHVPEDAMWTRIHVDGKHCLIGHIVGNIFYLVFLDKDHTFWKAELKHT
jgi:hypothetical protein